MQIVWHGQSCFQVIAENAKKEKITVVIDPFDEKLGLKIPSLKADILLITHQHSDHNNKAAVDGSPASPAGKLFLIEGPGEYEIKGVSVQGIPAFHDNSQGKERGGMTIYTIGAEEMRLCHLGDLGQKELTDEQVEEIGEIDILFIPVGSPGHSLDAKGASEIIGQIEPRIVIPMHYKLPGIKPELEPVDKFLKIMAVEKTEPQEKLTIKQKDLPEEETKIVVLKA